MSLIDLVHDQNGDILVIRVVEDAVILDGQETEFPFDADTADLLAQKLHTAAAAARRGDRTVRNFPESFDVTPVNGVSSIVEDGFIPCGPLKPDLLATGVRLHGGCACCDRAGEYNGFGSDGPRLFHCPKGCMCHD